MRSKDLAGAQAESRFFNVCSKRTPETPAWFVRIKKAGIPWDLRGVDAFAYFRPIEGHDRVKVPIQIKRSERGRERFILDKSLDMVENVLVIVVAPYMSDDSIRAFLYKELGNMREERKDFIDFMRRAMEKPISPYAKRFLSKGAARIRNLRDSG